jgi:hypothetical protein
MVFAQDPPQDTDDHEQQRNSIRSLVDTWPSRSITCAREAAGPNGAARAIGGARAGIASMATLPQLVIRSLEMNVTPDTLTLFSASVSPVQARCTLPDEGV